MTPGKFRTHRFQTQNGQGSLSGIFEQEPRIALRCCYRLEHDELSSSKVQYWVWRHPEVAASALQACLRPAAVRAVILGSRLQAGLTVVPRSLKLQFGALTEGAATLRSLLANHCPYSA